MLAGNICLTFLDPSRCASPLIRPFLDSRRRYLCVHRLCTVVPGDHHGNLRLLGANPWQNHRSWIIGFLSMRRPQFRIIRSDPIEPLRLPGRAYCGSRPLIWAARRPRQRVIAEPGDLSEAQFMTTVGRSRNRHTLIANNRPYVKEEIKDAFDASGLKVFNAYIPSPGLQLLC